MLKKLTDFSPSCSPHFEKNFLFPVVASRYSFPTKMLKSFLICLAPAVLAYAILLASMFGDSLADPAITAVVILLVIGAIVSGLCVGRHVFRAVKDPVFLKWTLAILSFLGVGLGYFAMASEGCCGIAVLGDGF
jgi:hypothetical protein